MRMLVFVCFLWSCAAQARDMTVTAISSSEPVVSMVTSKLYNKPIITIAKIGTEFSDICNNLADIVITFRTIQSQEQEACNKKGTSLQESVFGHAVIVFAKAYTKTPSTPYIFSIKQLTSALKRSMWSEINPNLPSTMVEIYGINYGIKELLAFTNFGNINSEAWLDVANDPELMVSKLVINPEAIGVFNYSYVMNNLHRLRPIALGDIPSTRNILSGNYPFTFPLTAYVRASLTQSRDIKAFLEELNKASVPTGYLNQLLPFTTAK